MIYSGQFKCTLDACVLYPAPVRDLLLHLAAAGLYKPFWSDEINGEWIRNLVANRPDLKEETLKGTVSAMNDAFPDANVSNYRQLLDTIHLPDDDDKHVLAAAIRSNSDVIITSNIKDFPDNELKSFDIEVQTPDLFICNLFDLNETIALNAFLNQVKNLKNPPQTENQVLITLEKCGLVETVKKIRQLLGSEKDTKSQGI